jgi:site-specific DNA recombinase
VRKVLDSPALLGLAVHKGQPLTDANGLPIQRADGIITREQFTAVLPKIAANQSRGEPRGNASPLLQVAFCGRCGAVMHASRAGGKYRYYQCAHTQPDRAPREGLTGRGRRGGR